MESKREKYKKEDYKPNGNPKMKATESNLIKEAFTCTKILELTFLDNLDSNSNLIVLTPIPRRLEQIIIRKLSSFFFSLQP